MAGKQKGMHKLVCAGRQMPSTAALERFIDIYLEIVKANEQRESEEKDKKS